MNQQSHTEISRVGEFGLIRRIEEVVRAGGGDPPEALLRGISDDAAVYRPAAGRLELLTTDALVEGVHFDLTFTSMKHLGWKSVVASLSDIAAMAGTPAYAAVTLCLPGKVTVEMVEEFYRGATFACRTYGCALVGGDTTTTQGPMVVSVTVVGDVEPSQVVYRNGAVAGDYLCVSGHLGASVAGLKILQREKEQFLAAQDGKAFTPQLEPYVTALEKHLMPKPRLDLVRLLAGRVRLHAMIDISDGLASEVHHLCAGSGTGAELYEHNVPVDGVTQQIAAEFAVSPVEYALYGGEEYELLFALSEEEYAKAEELTADATVIGRVTGSEAGVVLVREGGEREPLRERGWDHFSP